MSINIGCRFNGQPVPQPLKVENVTDFDCDMENVQLRYKIMSQLHEQYAINNNAGMQSVVSLLVGMFAVLGSFGYVWLHVPSNPLKFTENSFNGEQLLFVLAASLIVLLIMTYICMFQGTKQRCDQFIIQKIREKAFYRKWENAPKTKENIIEYEDIFPKGFNPYDKSGLGIVQGLYGEFAKIFAFVGAALCVVSYYKLIGIVLYEGIAIYSVLCLVAYALLWILFLVYMICKYEKKCEDSSTLCTWKKTLRILQHLYNTVLIWEVVMACSIQLCVWMTDVYSTKVGYDTRETCVAPELEKPPVEPCDRKNFE